MQDSSICFKVVQHDFKYIQDHSRMRFRISLPLTIGFSLSTAKSCRTGAICRTYRRLCSSCVSTLSSGQLGALSQCAGFSTDVPDRLSSQKSLSKKSHLLKICLKKAATQLLPMKALFTEVCQYVRLQCSSIVHVAYTLQNPRHPSVKTQPTKTFVQMIGYCYAIGKP